MKKATIKIEVLKEGQIASCVTDAAGEIWAIMLGLTNAIKETELKVPEEHRADYRARILAMLNDRD